MTTRYKPLTAIFVFLWIFVFTKEINSQSEVFSKTRNLVQDNKWEEVISLIDKELTTATTDKELLIFQKAYSLYQLKKFTPAEELFVSLKKNEKLFSEYVLYFLGMIYFNQSQWDKAKQHFEIILKEKPNLKLKNEAMFYLSQIYIKEKKFKLANGQLVKLEKVSRGTDQHPEILFQLALTEDELGKRNLMCSHLKRLYAQFPQFERLSSWGYNLSDNQFNQKNTKCPWEIEDFKRRVRNSLWAGLEKKAYDEILKFKSDFSGKYEFEADKILATFHAQEGELEKSYEILKKYLKKNEDDYDFLTQFAPIAARSGDLSTSISAYYKAYKLRKKTSKGLQSLFQAAFMSYQLQDYDWATRKFNEFIKLSRNQKLNKESEWYLAWMKYLRGDYEKSYAEFKKLGSTKNKKKFRSISKDRLNYWMGMSLYRQNKLDKAKVYFERLSLDKQKGYYAIASLKRLDKINSDIKRNSSKENLIGNGANRAYKITRFQLEDFLVPNNDEVPLDEDAISENEEIEEEADPFNPEQTIASDKIAVIPDEIPFKTPELLKRFESARSLMILGLNEWAKWDLYEIERRTKNKDYLKVLMNEYFLVGQYYRMSHISEVFFESQIKQKNLENVKQLWEYSFPKAYPQLVDKYSKEFEVSQELVWSIMKAESQYRREAISPVGALGLMQVMPYTGNRIAEILGDKQFSSKNLLEADSAIRIGTKYLQRLNRKFNQALPLVAASYNAGPHRVKNWLQLFGHLETDEFIEHIPFLETRNYVKKVIKNSYIYSTLYNESKGDQVPFLAEKLPFTVKEKAPTKEIWEEI